jgi:hypothetical protein
VVHEAATNARQAVLISIGPFLFNSALAALIGFPAALKVFNFATSASPVDFILVWLAVSIGMHAFPSRVDAKSMWQQVKASGSVVAKIFVVPLVGLIYVLSLASFFWADLIYGIGLVIGLPTLLVQVLA